MSNRSHPVVLPKKPTTPSTLTADISGHQGAVLVVRFNSDGEYLLSAGADRIIRLWNPYKSDVQEDDELQQFQKQQLVQQSKSHVSSLSSSSTSSVDHPSDSTVSSTFHTGKCISTYKGEHGSEVLDLCLTHDNNHMYSVGGDRFIVQWDIVHGTGLRRFKGHDQRVNTIAIHQDQSHNHNIVATGSYDATVKLWDLRTPSRDALQVMRDARDSISSIVIHGESVIAASIDGAIRTYDIRNSRLLTDGLGHSVPVCRVSHDGQLLLGSCDDDVLRLIDRSNGNILNEYKGHHTMKESKIECLFDNYDTHILTGSYDGQVVTYDLVDGTCVHNFVAHDKAITSMCYHPDKAILATASLDQHIKVWTA